MTNRDTTELLHPYEDFYITWFHHHPQAKPYAWRGTLWWKLGPFATHVDGDVRHDVHDLLIDKLEEHFPHGKTKTNS